MSGASTEWICPCGHVMHVPGSERWPAPAGHVTMWCKPCGGTQPFTRTR
jgi:hypothetical protein